MATTTVDPPAGPRAVPQTQKTPLGRPRNDGKPPGSVPKSVKASITGDDESFWEEMDSTPKDAWNQRICYLWRTSPILDLSGGGKPVTIEKIVHPFDATYILNTHGSGGYRFDISEIPKDGSKQKRIRQSYQMLLDQRYPPKIAYGTWLDDPRNSEWAWAKPALLEEAQRIAAPQAAQTPAEALVDYLDVATKVKELTGGNDDASLSKIVVTMLQNSQTALRDYQDPAKQMATLKAMIEMAGGASKSEDSSTTAMLLKMLIDQNKDLRQEIRESRQNPSDPFEAFSKVLNLVTGLGVNIGGNGGGPVHRGDVIASTVGDIVTKVVDKAADLAPAIIQAYQFGKQADLQIAQHGQQKAANPRPWEFQANAAPIATAPPPAPPLAPPPVAAPAPIPTGPMTPQLLFQKWGNLIREIFPQLQDFFRNQTGDDFRDWFLDRKGGDLWASFKKDATPELLTALTQMAPELKAVFTPEDKVLLFFANMLDDEEEEDDDEENTLPIAKEDANV